MGLGSGNITATVQLMLSIKGTLPESYVDGASAANRKVGPMGAADGWRILAETFSSSSLPVPLEVLPLDVTIPGGGTQDIDLSAAEIVGAVDGNGDPAKTEDLNGKRLMGFVLSTLTPEGGTANTAAIGVAPKDVATGYHLFGAGREDGVEIPIDSALMFITKTSNTELVATAGKRLITISGTAGDVLNLLLLFQ